MKSSGGGTEVWKDVDPIIRSDKMCIDIFTTKKNLNVDFDFYYI